MILYNNMEPTEENIKKAYTEDLLGRKDDVDKFAAFLKEEYCPVSVAVDGEWGSGKTFFVKQVAYRLDEDPLDDPKKCLTVYYDAWENDNDCDPILSIVDCIARAAEKKKGISVGAIMADILDIAAEGLNNPSLRWNQVFRDKNPKHDTKSDFSHYETEPINKQVKNKLKEIYDSIIKKPDERLIIFVDELDRCKPDFVVSVLERIEHYISLDNRVRIVFSVNRKQLEHIIRDYYGDNFDAENYLKRFLISSTKIPEADVLKYISRYDTQQKYLLKIDMLEEIILYFGIQIREINAFMSALVSARERAQKERAIRGFDLNRIMEDVFPVLLAEKFTNSEDYEILIRGEGTKILESFWKDGLGCSESELENHMNMYLSVFSKPGTALCVDHTYAKEDILSYLTKPFGV